MTKNEKRFPLQLSSVMDSSKQQTHRQSPSTHLIKTATPQTATQNAARHGATKHEVTKASLSPSSSSSSANQKIKSDQTASNVVSSRPLVSDGVRRAMVSRVAQQGVKDRLVLAALEAIPRHLFIESGMSSQAST